MAEAPVDMVTVSDDDQTAATDLGPPEQAKVVFERPQPPRQEMGRKSTCSTAWWDLKTSPNMDPAADLDPITVQRVGEILNLLKDQMLHALRESKSTVEQELRQELIVQTMELQQLRDDLTKADRQMKRLSTAVVASQAQEEQYRGLVAGLRLEKELLVAQLKTLEQAAEDTRADADKLSVELTGLVTQRMQDGLVLTTLQSETSALKQELLELKKEYEDVVAEEAKAQHDREAAEESLREFEARVRKVKKGSQGESASKRV